MSKTTKVWLIVDGVILSVALILLSLGFIFSRFLFKDSPRFHNISNVNVQEDFQSADSLHLKIAYGNINVSYGDKFEVDAENIEEKRFDTRISGNTLYVEYDVNNFLDTGIWNNVTNASAPTFNITVPHSIQLDGCRIESGATNLHINGIKASDVVLETGAGNIIAKNIAFDGLTLSGGAGNSEIMGAITGDIDVGSGVGEVKLDITGNIDDYDIDMDCGVGSISINDQTYNGIGSQRKHTSGAENNITASCGVGQIKININE